MFHSGIPPAGDDAHAVNRNRGAHLPLGHEARRVVDRLGTSSLTNPSTQQARHQTILELCQLTWHNGPEC